MCMQMLFYWRLMKNLTTYFTKIELTLWTSSILLILISFLLFDRENCLTLLASVIGATSLIFCAKGNPAGQFLMIIFSILYGIISYTFAYYGEMLTYLGMTGPMAVFALISWLKNPYKGNKAQVEVNHLSRKEFMFSIVLTIFITIVFYFILKWFDTANLGFSTLSVTTSFLAVYLTFRRSAYYALAYAANDIVLIILWVLASTENPSYISVVVCFISFLVNDLYGFISWKSMAKKQKEA